MHVRHRLIEKKFLKCTFKGSAKLQFYRPILIQPLRDKTRDTGLLPADSTPHLDHRDPLLA